MACMHSLVMEGGYNQLEVPGHPLLAPQMMTKNKGAAISQHVRNTVSRDLLCRGESLWLLNFVIFQMLLALKVSKPR